MVCENCKRYLNENRMLKEELRKIKLANDIILKGEPNNGELELFKGVGYWTIKEIIVNDGKKTESRTQVDYENVIYLIELLRKQFKTTFSPKWIWNLIINDKNLNITVDEFNGGKYRSKYYFPLYYYPLKVLDHLEVVNYDKNGYVTLLGNKDIDLPSDSLSLEKFF